MRPPNVCDLCPHPRKPVHGKARIELNEFDVHGPAPINLRLELCKEHYEALRKTIKEMLGI